MNQNDYFNIKLPLIWMNSLSRHATVCQSDWTIQFQTTVKVRIHRKTPAIKFFLQKCDLAFSKKGFRCRSCLVNLANVFKVNFV